MKKSLRILTLVLWVWACNKEDVKKGNLTLQSNQVNESVDISFIELYNGYEMKMEGTSTFFMVYLDDLKEGEYTFEKGASNVFVWLHHHYSSYNETTGGYLRIESNNEEKVSGHFYLICQSDYDNSRDTIHGVFENVPVLHTPVKGKTQMCGLVNDEAKCTSKWDHRDYDDVMAWTLFRPDDEFISLYINTKKMVPGIYPLNKDSFSVRTLDPAIEYYLDGNLYLSTLGTGSLEIISHDMEKKELITLLNGNMGNHKSAERIQLTNIRVTLYY